MTGSPLKGRAVTGPRRGPRSDMADLVLAYMRATQREQDRHRATDPDWANRPGSTAPIWHSVTGLAHYLRQPPDRIRRALHGLEGDRAIERTRSAKGHLYRLIPDNVTPPPTEEAP